jgi:hypothetical protein
MFLRPGIWQRVGSIRKRGRFQRSHYLSDLVPQFMVSHADHLKLFLDELPFSDDRVQILGFSSPPICQSVAILLIQRIE